ncbi:MAG: isoprenylcysteine carboxylmethyltransferase family protein [Gammaproteobacteria bacterium]
MEEPGAWRRIFGSGPLGTLVSVALLAAAMVIQARTDLPSLGLPMGIRIAVLAVGLLATVALVAWSVRSLPVDARGRTLCTEGPFALMRHPLYAAFLLFLCPALAVFLDEWIFLLWAALLFPLWHLVVASEERLMAERFGPEWDRYAARTGRFFPRLVQHAGRRRT